MNGDEVQVEALLDQARREGLAIVNPSRLLAVAADQNRLALFEKLWAACETPWRGSEAPHLLQHAARVGSLRVLTELLQRAPTRADDAAAALESAVQQALPEAVRALLNHQVIDVTGPDAAYALSLACLLGRVEICSLLLAAGVPIDRGCERADPPLLSAVAANQLEAVELLLAQGADLGVVDEAGDDAMALALRMGPGPMLSRLSRELASRASNAPNTQGALASHQLA